MSSPTSLDDLSNMPETGNTIKTLHELKQESSPDSNNEMNIDGEMSNDNSNHSSNHKMHTYDGDFVMDNEYNDYEELRKSLVNKRRLSSIKRPHGPFWITTTKSISVLFEITNRNIITNISLFREKRLVFFINNMLRNR